MLLSLGMVNGATGSMSSFAGPANLCVYGRFLYVADSGLLLSYKFPTSYYFLSFVMNKNEHNCMQPYTNNSVLSLNQYPNH